MNMNNFAINIFLTAAMILICFNCSASVKQQTPQKVVAKEKKKVKENTPKKNAVKPAKKVDYVLTVKAPVKTSGAKKSSPDPTDSSKETNTIKKKDLSSSDSGKNDNAVQKAVAKKDGSYSNFIRVKTVYELATDANPAMFMPHDEFETASEYQERVSGQVTLMKEIVQMTSQKMDIKKAQRIQVANDKELKRKSILENIMTDSSSPIVFTPTDIGRYDAENETFPVILHSTQYQISVPREEARTFKSNFKTVKIKGLKQLKPKYDVSIKVSKAHIRSRPNGSIVGIASKYDSFEHIKDEDEWYKINYKGQFCFTHVNNAELKLVDIADEYEYYDLVAIHPTTGSMFAMTSVDKLVKAPLNLASRKLYESGQPDGPK